MAFYPVAFSFPTVNVETQDEKKIVLVSGLTEGYQALFIEQQIEEHLGIEHRPVPGEMAR
jgi:hypothetical protein